MNTGAGGTDVVAIVAVAQANWPHDASAGSEAVWTSWARKLGPYSFDEVRAALDELVTTHTRLPSLAEILQVLTAHRRAVAAGVKAEATNVVPPAGAGTGAQAVSWVLEHSRARGNARLVLISIAACRHRDGENAWPSVESLAREAGVSERTVQYAVRRLERLGELRVVRRNADNGRTERNRYDVIMSPGSIEGCSARGEGADAAAGADAAGAGVQPVAGAGADVAGGPGGEGKSDRTRINPPTPLPGGSLVSDPIREVFDAYTEATHRRGTYRLTDKRRRLVATALRDYPLEDVLDALRGWQNDPWPERPLHTQIEVLLRDAAHIEKFRDLWRHGPPPPRLPDRYRDILSAPNLFEGSP
jgi:Helix-turn-helix domain